MKNEVFLTIDVFSVRLQAHIFLLVRYTAALRENHLHLCGCRSAVVRPAAYQGKVRTACSNAHLIR